jgi:hypothetical protein
MRDFNEVEIIFGSIVYLMDVSNIGKWLQGQFTYNRNRKARGPTWEHRDEYYSR